MRSVTHVTLFSMMRHPIKPRSRAALRRVGDVGDASFLSIYQNKKSSLGKFMGITPFMRHPSPVRHRPHDTRLSRSACSLTATLSNARRHALQPGCADSLAEVGKRTQRRGYHKVVSRLRPSLGLSPSEKAEPRTHTGPSIGADTTHQMQVRCAGARVSGYSPPRGV